MHLGTSFHIFCTWQNVFLRKTWEVELVKLTLIIWGHDHVHLETLVDKKCRDAKKGGDKDFQVSDEQVGQATRTFKSRLDLGTFPQGLLFPSLLTVIQINSSRHQHDLWKLWWKLQNFNCNLFFLLLLPLFLPQVNLQYLSNNSKLHPSLIFLDVFLQYFSKTKTMHQYVNIVTTKCVGLFVVFERHFKVSLCLVSEHPRKDLRPTYWGPCKDGSYLLMCCNAFYEKSQSLYNTFYEKCEKWLLKDG